MFASSSGHGGSDGGAVLVEMAYRPQVTGMMKAAAKQAPRWKVARGVDVLEQQAYAQFELWTGLDAPTEVMGRAMRDAMEEQQKTKIKEGL